MIYALDTNTISYILRGDVAVQQCMQQAGEKGDTVIIPLIAYYEVKRGLVYSGATVKFNAFKALCAKLKVENMNIYDIDAAAIIYADKKRDGRLLEDTDLLIAACCIANDYTLVTNNVKHFENITGLRYVNWSGSA